MTWTTCPRCKGSGHEVIVATDADGTTRIIYEDACTLCLGDRGIAGSGHMLMLEQNSDEIAEIILEWLERAPG